MNRLTRRSKKSINEIHDDIVIAGLKVTTNNKLPDGVMVVSINEGKRLAKLVADATAKAIAKAETENNITTENEGK